MHLLQDMRNNKSLLSLPIDAPAMVIDQLQYLVYTGSMAYGVTNQSSDYDVFGFCIPHKTDIFPHLRGEINGFGKRSNPFNQWTQHHIMFREKEYDLTIYSIIKFFQLCMENNPNMVDLLFVPQRCILHMTSISGYMREHRKDFLHKGSYHKFKGYAYSQLSKMKTKNPTGQRKETLINGIDYKYAYHLVRLILEVEQILTEGDLDLERNSALLRHIREGNWSAEKIDDFFNSKEETLEKLYDASTLPYSPDEDKIKNILLNCLEMHFGNLSDSVITEDKAALAIKQIKQIIDDSGY